MTTSGTHADRDRAEAHDDGAVLVLALLMSGLLAALGLGLLMISDTERRAASNASASLETLSAADAGIERALLDLRQTANLAPFLNGGQQSGFSDDTRRVTLPFGGTFDLDAASADLEAESTASGTFGTNTPRWQLMAWGRLADLAAPGAINSLQYVAVWIADDPADADGDPLADENGRVTLHAEALGPGGARRRIEVTIQKTAGDVRVISWREVR